MAEMDLSGMAEVSIKRLVSRLNDLKVLAQDVYNESVETKCKIKCGRILIQANDYDDGEKESLKVIIRHLLKRWPKRVLQGLDLSSAAGIDSLLIKLKMGTFDDLHVDGDDFGNEEEEARPMKRARVGENSSEPRCSTPLVAVASSCSPTQASRPHTRHHDPDPPRPQGQAPVRDYPAHRPGQAPARDHPAHLPGQAPARDHPADVARPIEAVYDDDSSVPEPFPHDG